MANTIDVDALAEKTRRDEMERVNQKVESVRALAASARHAGELEEQLEAAKAEWAAAYQRSVQLGLPERDLAKLKPPAGARVRAPGRRSRGAASGEVSD